MERGPVHHARRSSYILRKGGARVEVAPGNLIISWLPFSAFSSVVYTFKFVAEAINEL